MLGDDEPDRVIHRRIASLVEEEHALERGLALPLEEHRLDGISAELDQCWDLLRQRHARAAPVSVVDSYLQ
jgi:Protein of unknown function (DUF2630)